MPDYFREGFEELKETAKALMEASQATNRAGEHLVKATDAALHAKGEHEDLRETVHRLESMILTLTTEIRELRDGRR